MKNQDNRIKNGLSVKVTAADVYKRNVMIRMAMIAISVLMILFTVTYAFVYITSQTGYFTIELDPNLKAKNKLLISSESTFKNTPLILKTDALPYMDNISERWIPEDVDKIEGPHSQDNYLAYTFFIRNDGDEDMEYMTEINIISVVKNVDEAIRVAVYKNGEKTVYAKRNRETQLPEENTKPFNSITQVMSVKQEPLKKGAVDRYTVVVWLEGDDPHCIDDIMGGEMKMKMLITEVQSGD